MMHQSKADFQAYMLNNVFKCDVRNLEKVKIVKFHFCIFEQ